MIWGGSGGGTGAIAAGTGAVEAGVTGVVAGCSKGTSTKRDMRALTGEKSANLYTGPCTSSRNIFRTEIISLLNIILCVRMIFDFIKHEKRPIRNC